jgi:hypothetical protein
MTSCRPHCKFPEIAVYFRLAPVLRQYEVILAPGGGMDTQHSDAIAKMLGEIRTTSLYIR